MARSFLSALALIILATAAYAGPARETSREAVASHQHDYWLSNGLNRLVFWQAPQTGSVQTRGQ